MEVEVCVCVSSGDNKQGFCPPEQTIVLVAVSEILFTVSVPVSITV
jgi:hypothetical protein